MIFKKYIEENYNNSILNIKIIPNAKNSEFITIMDNWVLKIKIAAIPEKWRANKELISFLSQELRLKKDDITIISGETSQLKRIKINFS